MGNLTKIQGAILGLCMFFAIAGLVMFSLFKSKGASNQINVTLWGTVKSSQMAPLIAQAVATPAGKDVRINYVQKSADTFDADFIEALASGGGPDAILIGSDSLMRHVSKIITIPYNTFSSQNYRSSFIQGSEAYLTSEGILALPFLVDPMVMYWNRDIFNNANIAVPPKTWPEFITLAPQLTIRDGALNITQSAVGLGEGRNVTNAKEIVSLLMMQAGNPISSFVYGSNVQYSLIGPKAAGALDFYTQFANPVKQVYSWNRSLPESKNLFISNRLAVYFGYASELQEIKAKNPNLNFSVALMPQTKEQQGVTPVKMTYGHFQGISIVRSARNPANAFKALSLLVAPDVIRAGTTITGLPSVRRDTISVDSSNDATAVFATSALWSRTWLESDKEATKQIFRNMIEDVTSGRTNSSGAIGEAQAAITSTIR